MIDIVCPLCGLGNLTERGRPPTNTGAHNQLVIGLVDSICDRCGETIVTPEQSRINKRIIIDARNRQQR